MKCLGWVDRHSRVDGICKPVVHTLDSLVHRRHLGVMPGDCSLL